MAGKLTPLDIQREGKASESTPTVTGFISL
jgi:hypothetical protein